MDVFAVEVREAKKLYNNQPVLNSMSMKVPQKSMCGYLLISVIILIVLKFSYALCGASGCGKTTLLKAILSCIDLDVGKISINGFEVNKNRQANCKIGFMPQEPGIFNDMTMLENLKFFGYIYGLSSQYLNSRVIYLSDIFELSSIEKSRNISTLSGGQQRRVSLMISLLHMPQILILDE